MSSTCQKGVLNCYEGTCWFYEWRETQVEATALWFVGFSIYLFSLVSQFDILYLSFKGLLQTVCLLLSEIAFLFLQKLDNISSGSVVSYSVSFMLAPQAWQTKQQ